MKFSPTDQIIDIFQINVIHFQKMNTFQNVEDFPDWLKDAKSNWRNPIGSFWNDGYDDDSENYCGHIEYNGLDYYVKPGDYIVLLRDRIMPVNQELFELLFVKNNDSEE